MTTEKPHWVTVLPGRHFRHNGRRVGAGKDLPLSPTEAAQMVAAGHCRYASESDDVGEDHEDLDHPKTQEGDSSGEGDTDGSDETDPPASDAEKSPDLLDQEKT
ncbi:hypothetical protein [Gluconobacter cerinus]|uniref:Uncharacterized protein n=1 Tax=Gluconobacter cerinus TaxID=38307 RepID=A0AAV5NC59_9PROT|nr:hypothetical protein [Gluconobacter cerinus]GBR03147.1 hypothetical protein AA0229_1874 [Gluconobacter cerinus NRIC 0229]GLQ61554.1 hypothetical protein GCM10007867_03990 [Gluconobacter cerinus]